MTIHATAIVSPSAKVDPDVEIGPYCIIEDDVEVGAGCRLASAVVLKQGTRLGQDNILEVGAVLGGAPQHLGVGDEVGDLCVGNRNQIREYVTIHRAMQPGHTTRLGDNNMLMASSHVAHDCLLGDHNILANNVMLAGHVDVADRNYFGGGSAVHQFCRVGSLTMIGGLARVTRDVPPFVMVDGNTAMMVGLNQVGLRRAGMSVEQRKILKDAYRCAFRTGGSFEQRLADLRSRFPSDPGRQLWRFLEESQRGFLQDRGRNQGKSVSSSTHSQSDDAPDRSQEVAEPRILPFRRAA